MKAAGIARGFLALLITVAAVGCAPVVDVTKTSKGFHAPTNPNDVEVLMLKPDRKFVELGAISTYNWPMTETAKMHNALRAKSAPLGANAVIILGSGLVPGSGGSGILWVTGVAIRYE